ncbi:hypothetical protein O181_019437 [Austropuccinia psidii MF-1]|uniref:Uncharacterized protein n=1 Tax=Austropuccinia psidii MF-1 TaxID=1389203 RepID=A0A9Q3C9Q5_9BASI|nr:hypothetical protein [Austropuccinia psidii MF-1]
MLTLWKFILFLSFDLLSGLGCLTFGNEALNEDDDLLHALLSSLQSPLEPPQTIEALSQPLSSSCLGANQPIYPSNGHNNPLLPHPQLHPVHSYFPFDRSVHESHPNKRLSKRQFQMFAMIFFHN